MKVGNVFSDVPQSTADEHFTSLLTADGLRIERIVSRGHASAPGTWYDQDQHEWILLLKGSAALEFEGEGELIELRPGSYLNITAHCRHRVAWTDPRGETVWLAVHYGP